MKRVLVLLLLLYPLSAEAQMYQYTDENGTVSFAEDLGSVPKKYRKKAKPLGAEEGAPQGTEATEATEEATDKPKVDKVDKAGKVDEAQKEKKLYGGKDEAAWRKEFATVKYDVQAGEAELVDLRGRLNDTSSMTRGEYLAIQNTIKHSENRLQGFKKRLELLEQRADRDEVPMEFRY